MEEVFLKTPSLEGRITIGEGAAALRLPSLVKERKNFVVTDSNVFALYGEFLREYFGDGEVFVLPAGEENKNFQRLFEILKRMTEAGLHRTSRLFAVGGGVVGDIGGLAAAADGEIDGVVLTGGIANSELLVEKLRRKVRFIAPVAVIPGEFEMEALAAGITRVLKGEAKARVYREHEEEGA